jgi:tetratricopeptide (TPR) repeat protein
MSNSANQWTVNALKAAMAHGISYWGQLADLSHDQFAQIVEQHGGRYIRFSNHGSFAVVVMGAASLPVLPSSEPIELPSARLISEQEFMTLLSIAHSDEDRLFTARALAEVMNIPEARIHAWAKAGLIKPAQAELGVARFDFRQAAIARSLCDMTGVGLSIEKIRRTLRQLQARMPDLKEPLQQLKILEHNGPLLVRLESGDLAEVTGQMQLQFDNAPQPEPAGLRLVPTLTSADWHQQAIEQEKAGMLDEAEQSYRQAMLCGGPAPQLAFDLATLLTKLGKIPQAIERYLLAVELDPNYSEAWNNLGILQAQAGELQGACDAFRRGLSIAPEDARLHYNLADALDTMGFCEEARKHWQMYLRYDPAGPPWSEYARERLRTRA